MDGSFTKIKSRIVDVLGIAVLSANFFRFALVHTFFLIFTNLHGVFINTLLYRVTGENTIILQYNLIFYLAFSVSMPLAAVLMRKTSPRISSRVGILLFIGMYLTFFGLMFTNTLAIGMPAIAILSAFASSAYWIAYNVMLIEFTHVNERDVAISFMGMSGGTVSLIMPALSGFVISQFSGMMGYYVMFGVSMLIAIITMLLSTLKIPPIPSKTNRLYFQSAFSHLVKTRVWRSCMFCEFLKGIREGTFAFFLNLLLFDLVQNEALIGFNTLLVGVLAILANWTISRFMRPEHRVKWMLIATTVLFVASGLLFLELNAATIIIMSIANSYFNVILLNPTTPVLFSLFNRTEEGKKAKYEFLAMKDSSLGVGRCLGVIMVLLFPQTHMGYLVAMGVLTVTQYLTVLVTKHSMNLLEKLPQSEA